MTITINWTDDTQTCIHVVYGADWGWDLFFATDDRAREMMDSIDHKADFILDLTFAQIPRNVVGQFPKFVKGAVSLTHPNSRSVIIVGTNSHYRILLDVFRKVYTPASQKVTLVATLDEAKKILAQQHDENDATVQP